LHHCISRGRGIILALIHLFRICRFLSFEYNIAPFWSILSSEIARRLALSRQIAPLIDFCLFSVVCCLFSYNTIFLLFSCEEDTKMGKGEGDWSFISLLLREVWQICNVHIACQMPVHNVVLLYYHPSVCSEC